MNRILAFLATLTVAAPALAAYDPRYVRRLDIDTSLEWHNLLTDKTGTGVAVFADSPVFVDDITLGATGVYLSSTGDVLTMGGLGAGQDNECLTWNFDVGDNNTVTLGSTCGTNFIYATALSGIRFSNTGSVQFGDSNYSVGMSSFGVRIQPHLVLATSDPGDSFNLRFQNGGGMSWESNPSGVDASLSLSASNILTLAVAAGLELTGSGADISVPSGGRLNVEGQSGDSWVAKDLGDVNIIDDGGTAAIFGNGSGGYQLRAGTGGTVALPFFTFFGDHDTGIYRLADNHMGVSVGGAVRLQFAGANGVDIGGACNTGHVQGAGDTQVCGGLEVDGDLHVDNQMFRNADNRTIADNGAGTPATLLLDPSTSYVAVTCDDTDGCDLTMWETGHQDGEGLRICNVSANVISLPDTAGVTEIAGAWAGGRYDCIDLMYMSTPVSTWIETGRSDN